MYMLEELIKWAMLGGFGIMYPGNTDRSFIARYAWN